MAIKGIKQGAVATLTQDLKGYVRDIRAFPMKISTSNIEKAIKGSKTEAALRNAIKSINTSIEKELAEYINHTIKQLGNIEIEYKKNDQSAVGINTAIKKS